MHVIINVLLIIICIDQKNICDQRQIDQSFTKIHYFPRKYIGYFTPGKIIRGYDFPITGYVQYW